MIHYKVVLEMELDAENPHEAAMMMEKMALNSDAQFIYVVQNDETGEIYTVDLGEPEEDSVLPDPDHEPLITATVVPTVLIKEDVVTCEGCKEEIPNGSLYCPNCGDENF